MGLTSALIGLQTAQTVASIQYAVAARILQMQRDNGVSAAKLIEAAARQVDGAAGEVLGITANLDVYA